MSSYLYHHGIKGMKWGVRRYQNKDGSLTDAGKRRLGSISDNNKRVNFDENSGRIDSGKSNLRKARSAIHEEIASDYRNVSQASRSASEAANRMSKISRDSASRKQQKAMDKMDVSTMSDSELRQRINRMNLERQYKQMATEDVARGRQRTSEILATAGDIAAIGASAATIAATIYALTK